MHSMNDSMHDSHKTPEQLLRADVDTPNTETLKQRGDVIRKVVEGWSLRVIETSLAQSLEQSSVRTAAAVPLPNDEDNEVNDDPDNEGKGNDENDDEVELVRVVSASEIDERKIQAADVVDVSLSEEQRMLSLEQTVARHEVEMAQLRDQIQQLMV